MAKRTAILEPAKVFVKKLTALDYSISTRDKFRDLCELAYCAHAKVMAPTKERADELEARYMSIVNRYKDKDTIRAYPELVGIAWEAVMGGGVDFLGTVAGELELLDAGQGQFFTPFEVSRMMAAITLSDAGKIIDEKGYISVLEPAAGAGGMVLAFADALQGQGFNPVIHMLVNAIDISPMAYWMCYLQLTWRGIPAFVERGNTLSLERFESAWTAGAHLFHHYHGHLFEDIQEEHAETDAQPEQPTAPQVERTERPELVSLFADLPPLVATTHVRVTRPAREAGADINVEQLSLFEEK